MSSFSSLNPATGEVVWSGPAAAVVEVDAGVSRARTAFRTWSRKPLEERTAHLQAFARVLANRRATLADAIAREVGKPLWEALTEVQSMIGKIDLSLRAYAQRCAEFSGGPAVTRFRPHGVVAVFGPFNFPGHLPNGHIVPALLAGNTVVFKPSERAPLVAELTVAAWKDAGLPADVLTLTQGGRDTGAALATHAGIDGLFFTGSSTAGQWLAELFARTPGRILALEMGGNNPLVVWSPGDLRAAALLVAESAFITAGQRCTCARRLILPTGKAGDALITELRAVISRLRVGAPLDVPEPFMGPVISSASATELHDAQAALVAAGAQPLVESRLLRAGTGLVSPGLIDVTAVKVREDREVFGPLLQVIRVPSFDDAIREANATRFGLAAGLVSEDRALYDQFHAEIRAGIINWNQPLTGASGAAPFGGVGASGNHRPSGFFAADYCSYPVASIEIPQLKPAAKAPPGLSP
jgi:succinylglutamic semialdehyde dehydrogenase